MEFKDYLLGDVLVKYIINDEKNIGMVLIPKGTEDKVQNPWEWDKNFDFRARYNRNWNLGSLAYYHVEGDALSLSGFTMRDQLSTMQMKYQDQIVTTDGDTTKISTVLKSEKGYKIIHNLTHIKGLRGFVCSTEFVNETDTALNLDMLTSFSLDNLGPYAEDDGPNRYYLHRFFGGWSLEGKHLCQSVEELGLEKSWASYNNPVERFGSLGSYPVQRYFPTAVVEDRKAGVLWGARIAHNASWQMELGRFQDSFAFTGGLGDNYFCGWSKHLEVGESFTSPEAYICAVTGDIDDACAALCDMHKPAWRAYGEQGLPTSFNEYCTTWGKPTQAKMLSYCKNLKELGVKYAVIDAGWCVEGQEQRGNGEWPIDKNIFPDMKAMNKTIREMGMIPGVWFEFEVTTIGSRMFEPDYDYMHLTHKGEVVKNHTIRSYWDFRRKDVQDYLYEKVIKMLKDNDFGYIKVDYNANIGPQVDGAESGAEALRQHLEAVRDFFKRMKQEIPDLIIENCASGGHRLEPSMMGVAAVSSFSDAHEAVEIPYIAASLQRQMLPQQSLIWAVLHTDDDKKRLCYSLAATFLGRVCLSGQIDVLAPWQLEIVDEALKFYKKCETVISDGDSKIYGNRGTNTRYPTGTQVVVRKTETEILAVCHAFDDASASIAIDIPEGFEIAESFNAKDVCVTDNQLIIPAMEDMSACAVLLKKA